MAIGLPMPRGATVTSWWATEGQATVGAVEVIHRADSAIATLSWLGVARWARERGIGKLLIKSAIDHAGSEGAAALRLGSMAFSASAPTLLTESGFVERAYQEFRIAFERSLWDGRNAIRTGVLNPHLYGSSSSHGASAASLMVAMATIDSRFMLTPQVERVIAAEIDNHKGADAEVLLGMATAAARRSFDVAIHCALPPTLEPSRDIGEEGTVSAAARVPTAEQLVGLLSQRKIPLLRAPFERLNLRATEHDWQVVLGFDGLRFHVFDPRRPDQRDQCVTLTEMRKALADKQAACLVIGRS